MKIWVITEGTYSDYHVVGLASTLKKASWISSKIDDTNPPFCMEVDYLADIVRKLVYEVEIEVKSGKVSRLDEDHGTRRTLAIKPDIRATTMKGIYNYSTTTTKFVQCLRVLSYISYEHAEKVAVEYRQAHLRKEGFEPYVPVEGYDDILLDGE